jgi:hypothetical protein
VSDKDIHSRDQHLWGAIQVDSRSYTTQRCTLKTGRHTLNNDYWTLNAPLLAAWLACMHTCIIACLSPAYFIPSLYLLSLYPPSSDISRVFRTSTPASGPLPPTTDPSARKLIKHYERLILASGLSLVCLFSWLFIGQR